MSKVDRKVISTAAAPCPSFPYSQAVKVDGGSTMYISGQLGLCPTSMQLVEGIEQQTRQALNNIGEILKAAGGTYANVVKTTVLLTDMNDFAKVNAVYSEFFSDNKPARAAYQVAALPKDGLVEIEGVAVI